MGLQLLNLRKSFPHSVPCPKITRMTEILQTIVFSHLSTGILIHMGFFWRGNLCGSLTKVNRITYVLTNTIYNYLAKAKLD